MDSSEREIDGYKQCVSNADDLEAVRNSYKVCIPFYCQPYNISSVVYRCVCLSFNS